MKKLKLFTMACLLSVAFTAQAGNVQTLVINGEWPGSPSRAIMSF